MRAFLKASRSTFSNRDAFTKEELCIVIISIETRATAHAFLLRLHETAD